MKLPAPIARFAGRNLSERLAASRLLTVNASLIAIGVIILLMNLDNLPVAGGLTFMILGFGTSLGLLLKGRLSWASSCHLLISTLALPILDIFVMSDLGDLVLFNLAFALFLAAGLLIGARPRNLAILVAADFVGMAVGYPLNGGATPTLVYIQASHIQILILHFIMGTIAILTARDRHFLVQKTEEAAAASERQVAGLRSLLQSVQTTFDLGDLLTRASQESLRLAESIADDIAAARRQTTESAEMVRNYRTVAAESTNQVRKIRDFAADHLHAVTETTSTVSEMGKTIESIAGIARQRQTSLGELQTLSARSMDQMNRTDKAVGEVTGKANEISAIVHIIEDIASQTNLLAMNAAIEAAHAGESGRGFAVVAGEIRKLSQATAQNASQIRQSIDSTNKSVQHVAEVQAVSRQGIAAIQEEIKALAADFGIIIDRLQEISTGSREIVQAVGHIQEVTVQQNESVDTLNQDMETNNQRVDALAGAASENGAALDRILAQSRSISEAARSLDATGQSVKARIGELQSYLTSAG